MKSFRIVIMSFVLTFVFSTVAFAKAEQQIVLEQYPLIENIDELLKVSKKDGLLPDGAKVQTSLKKINDTRELLTNSEQKKVITHTAVEKYKKVKDVKTNKTKDVYRVTVISDVLKSDAQALSIIDSKERYDDSISVRSVARAYYEGEKERNGVTFTRISKWEVLYDNTDPYVRVLSPVVWAEAVGETYDGDMIPLNEHKEVSMLSENKYYTLIPYWGDEYVAHTKDFMGQEGGTHMNLTDGSDTWEFEVLLTYGFNR